MLAKAAGHEEASEGPEHTDALGSKIIKHEPDAKVLSFDFK